VIFAAASLLLPAAPAAADPADDAFLGGLARGGIPAPDPNSAVANAHAVCAGLTANQNSSVLAMRLSKGNGMSLKQSGYFIGVAVAAYCPENKDKAGVSVGWLLPFPPMM
jgi:hypothetical protein